jgi:ABC-type sugar transport system, periplasmic component
MKKVIKFLATTFVALSLVSTAFTGCNSSGGQSSSPAAVSSKSSASTVSTSIDKNISANITFWHTYSANSEAKVFNSDIIADFNKQYPNIKIKSVTMPTDNLKQQVLQAAASGSAPDVMRMDITWVPQFANMNSLVAVDKMPGFDTIKGNSYKASLTTCKWKNQYFGVPLDFNTQITIYNTKTLKAAGLTDAPKTFDELATAAEKIKSSHSNGLITIGGCGTWSMAPIFMSLGGQYCDDQYTKAEGYVNSDKSVAALTKLVEMNDKGLIGKCLLGGQPGTWDGLKTDNGYMSVQDGPWFFTLQDKKITGNYTPALVPTNIDKSISVVGGEDLVMFKSSKNQEAAWLFMNYMTTEFPQKTMALKVNQYPTNSKVAALPELAADPIFKIYSQQIETAWARIQNPSNEEMDKDISLAFEKSFRHKGTVKENLDALAKQLDALFAKNA